jgi:hypothetical protein
MSTGDDSDDGGDESTLGTAFGVLAHWKSIAIALGGLAVVWYTLQHPEITPNGYIPVFLGTALIAFGYAVYDSVNGRGRRHTA